MDSHFISQNHKKIKHFFSLDKTFFITYGEKGIGKSRFLSSQIQELVSKDTKIVCIQPKLFLKSSPLTAICSALHKSPITSYSDLLEELCETGNTILHIENPHFLLPDDQAILLEAVHFLLHSGKSQLRIILEFDEPKRCACFLDPLITFRNTYLVPFEKMDAEEFNASLKKFVTAPDHIINLILSYSGQNFSRLDELLLMLVGKGSADYDEGGKIICSDIAEIDLKSHKESDIIEQYTSLDEALKLVIRYSALMGPTVLSALLQSPLNIMASEHRLKDIETITGWIQKEDSLDFWKLLFHGSSVYNFEDELALKKIRDFSPSEEKDDLYRRLAKHLEMKYQSFSDKDALLHLAGTILSR